MYIIMYMYHFKECSLTFCNVQVFQVFCKNNPTCTWVNYFVNMLCCILQAWGFSHHSSHFHPPQHHRHSHLLPASPRLRPLPLQTPHHHTHHYHWRHASSCHVDSCNWSSWGRRCGPKYSSCWEQGKLCVTVSVLLNRTNCLNLDWS